MYKCHICGKPDKEIKLTSLGRTGCKDHSHFILDANCSSGESFHFSLKNIKHKAVIKEVCGTAWFDYDDSMIRTQI